MKLNEPNVRTYLSIFCPWAFFVLWIKPSFNLRLKFVKPQVEMIRFPKFWSTHAIFSITAPRVLSDYEFWFVEKEELWALLHAKPYHSRHIDHHGHRRNLRLWVFVKIRRYRVPQWGQVPSTKRSAKKCSQEVQYHCSSDYGIEPTTETHYNHLCYNIIIVITIPKQLLRDFRLVRCGSSTEMVKFDIEPFVDFSMDSWSTWVQWIPPKK